MAAELVAAITWQLERLALRHSAMVYPVPYSRERIRAFHSWGIPFSRVV